MRGDGELLARAQAGDEYAFGQLVDPYRRELQVYCYRFLGSVADAEDAPQDTLPSAWQHLAGFEGRASVRTWLYRVATSRCLDALRSARRRCRRPRRRPGWNRRNRPGSESCPGSSPTRTSCRRGSPTAHPAAGPI